MRFGNQLTPWEKETLSDVRKIINARKNSSALRHGDFYTLIADENIFAYIRSDMKERVLVVLNKSNSAENIEINFPGIYNLSRAADIFSGKEFLINSSRIIVNLPELSYKIFKLR
jgi:glycosidase